MNKLEERLKNIEKDVAEIMGLLPKTYCYGGILGPTDPILASAASAKEVTRIDTVLNALIKHLKLYAENVYGETHTEMRKINKGFFHGI